MVTSHYTFEYEQWTEESIRVVDIEDQVSKLKASPSNNNTFPLLKRPNYHVVYI